MRDPIKLLLKQAAKNSNLQVIIDSDLTDENIANLNQPKWIRIALTDLKRAKRIEAINAAVMALPKLYTEDFIGTIRKWTSQETYVKFGVSDLLINENDLLFITDRGIWCGLCNCKKANLEFINCNSVLIQTAKFTEYKRALLNDIKVKYSIPEDKPLYTVKGVSYFGEFPPV